jgi:hypothetical protein
MSTEAQRGGYTESWKDRETHRWIDRKKTEEQMGRLKY